jgi:putative flippase GtrA
MTTLNGGNGTPRQAAAGRITEQRRFAPVLDVVVPVYNEERDLGPCVHRLHAHLTEHVPFSFRITIADNASTDRTFACAEDLSREYPEVHVLQLEQKGRGRALRTAWAGSDAAVLVYMDVDLSTDLAGLLPLVAPLVSGHSDMAIGTRLHRGSRVVRGPKRELISRSYNVMLRRALAVRFSDAQCGFKAVRADVAAVLLPLVEDNGWFFDTELLVLAERAGLRIHEVPVDWVDDPGSTVRIVATAVADVRGILRVAAAAAAGNPDPQRITAALPDRVRARPARTAATGGLARVLRFAAVGVVATALYTVLFLAMRSSLGGQAANALALLLSTLANTAANRRLTFGIRGRTELVRHQLGGMFVLAVALPVTAGTLWLTQHVLASLGRAGELFAVLAANVFATALRYVMLRRLMSGPQERSAPADGQPIPAQRTAADRDCSADVPSTPQRNP